MQDRKNTEQGTMQDKPSQEGYRTGNNAGQTVTGGIQIYTGLDWRDALVGCRKVERQDRRDAEQERCWTGGIQERWDAGQVGCRTGGLHEWRDARKEGCRNRRLQERRAIQVIV